MCRKEYDVNLKFLRVYLYNIHSMYAESGQPQEPLERSFLLKELNLHPDTDDKV